MSQFNLHLWLILTAWMSMCLLGGAGTREWLLGRPYLIWTGRQGRKTVIGPMSTQRKHVLALLLALMLLGVVMRTH
jgi:hypothetical protein